MHNMIQPKHTPPNHQEEGSILPKIPHATQLRELPFRLNKLYQNNAAKEAQLESKESIKYLKQGLLSDLGFNNSFTQKKA